VPFLRGTVKHNSCEFKQDFTKQNISAYFEHIYRFRSALLMPDFVKVATCTDFHATAPPHGYDLCMRAVK